MHHEPAAIALLIDVCSQYQRVNNFTARTAGVILLNSYDPPDIVGHANCRTVHSETDFGVASLCPTLSHSIPPHQHRLAAWMDDGDTVVVHPKRIHGSYFAGGERRAERLICSEHIVSVIGVSCSTNESRDQN